jgi:D-methionine transport system substrate-binding protein
MKKKVFLSLVLLASAAVISVPGNAAEKKNLVFGFSPGPYVDIVKYAIKPFLEKKGYKVEIREFSDWVQPDIALGNKSIDANLFQHTVYLQKFAADHKLKLSPLIAVPTASIGLYSKKFKSIDKIKDGSTLTIPNDASNLARTLIFLKSLKLIDIKADIDPTKASEKDITSNPHKFVISPVEAAQLPRTLDSVEVSLVPGNYAISSGIYPTAIARETLIEPYINVIAVHTDDIDSKWVKDLKDVVESKDFITVINDPKFVFRDFQKPEWLKKKWKLQK